MFFKTKIVNRWAENRRDSIKREINNAKVEISWYEEGHVGINCSTKKLSDIWARKNYEVNKIQLEAYEKYGDNAYDRIKEASLFYPGFNVEADIRIRVTVLASKGRTNRITELNENELTEARKLANDLINKNIEKYRAAVL